MQARVLATELSGQVGREVHLEGWVHRIRDLGGVRFLVLRDRTGQAQVVVPPEIDLGEIGCEWVVAVGGTCGREPRAPAGVEITTGGQRIHDYEQLVDNIRTWGLDPRDFEGYLAAFKHGMCPHGGMGMGIERLLKQLLGLANIRQACAFPRDRRRLVP